MKIYRSKITGEFRGKLADGSFTRAFASVDELKAEVKRVRRNAARRELDQLRRDCGLTKTPYGWE